MSVPDHETSVNSTPTAVEKHYSFTKTLMSRRDSENMKHLISFHPANEINSPTARFEATEDLDNTGGRKSGNLRHLFMFFWTLSVHSMAVGMRNDTGNMGIIRRAFISSSN